MINYLMVDLGTGNSRVALVSSVGKIIDLISFENTYYPDHLYADARYFDPDEWQMRILSASKTMLERHRDVWVNAISAAGARETIVLIDKAGKAFYSLPNIDYRGQEYLNEIPNHQSIYRKSGKWVTEDFDASKLYGLRKKRPELYGRIDKITSLSEWIGQIFTGQVFCEPSQACETQLYDIHNHRWSSTLCKVYDIDMSILPQLRNAGDAIPILPKYKEMLRMTDDAVFIVGGADTQIGVMQTGITNGQIAVVSGTTSPVVTLTDTAVYDEKQRVWVDSGLGGENYAIETNPGVTGLNYQKFVARVCSSMGYAALEKAYAEKASFSCTAAFSSLLFHEQRGLRKGGFFTRSPMGDGMDMVDMAWAVLADIACSIHEQAVNLQELTGNHPNEIFGCGGGFQRPTLCQMLSDLCGVDVVLRGGFDQATLMGLLAVCNATMGEPSYEPSDQMIRYQPRKNQLIHEYQPVWKENRNRSNGVQG